MTIDAEITAWISLAKGDVAGHEFHGNQYSAGARSTAQEYQRAFGSGYKIGGPSGDSKIVAVSARGLAEYAPLRHFENDYNTAARLHTDLADAHEKLARALPEGSPQSAAHYDAMASHNLAASRARMVAQDMHVASDQTSSDKDYYNTVANDAANKSDAAAQSMGASVTKSAD